MKVIFIYDIEIRDKRDAQRLNKVKKIARKYLNHIQKSVFEGKLTESQIYKMQTEILKVIDKNVDNVIFYLIPDGVKIERRLLTNLEDKNRNIL